MGTSEACIGTSRIQFATRRGYKRECVCEDVRRFKYNRESACDEYARIGFESRRWTIGVITWGGGLRIESSE